MPRPARSRPLSPRSERTAGWVESRPVRSCCTRPTGGSVRRSSARPRSTHRSGNGSRVYSASAPRGRNIQMSSDPTISRRRFLESLAAVGVVVACGPTAAPAPSARSSASAAATLKPVSIEWGRRNYTPRSQSAETITSDAAVKGWKERNPNFTITIQGGPFGPETDQKFDIAILQQKAGPDVFHTTGGDVLKYAAAGQLSEPPLTDAERRDFNPSALQATTYKGTVVAYPISIVPGSRCINLDLFKEAGVTPPKDGSWTYDE